MHVIQPLFKIKIFVINIIFSHILVFWSKILFPILNAMLTLSKTTTSPRKLFPSDFIKNNLETSLKRVNSDPISDTDLRLYNLAPTNYKTRFGFLHFLKNSLSKTQNTQV